MAEFDPKLEVRSNEGLGVGFAELDMADPVALAPAQAITLAFAVE